MFTMITTCLAKMTRGYIACALWTATETDDELGDMQLSDDYNVSDFTYAAQEAMRARCDDFLETVKDVIVDAYLASDDIMTDFYEQLGHDLWLSHNGHGVNFQDRHPEDIAERLMAAAKRIPEGHVYVTDNGELGVDYL